MIAASTRVKQHFLLRELVFACSQTPPQQPQICCTVLTQAGWCAVRTVARCELPVAGTMEAGARVIW